MTIGYVEPLLSGWERMKRMLLRPFDAGKWLVLAFAAWLAGLGGNESMRWIWFEHDGSAHLSGWSVLGIPWSLTRSPGGAIVAGVALMLLLALAVALLWLSSRAKLVFLDCVVHDRAAIVEPWRRLRHLGDSLFLWRLGFSLVVFAMMLVLAIPLIGPALLLEQGADALRGLSVAAILVVTMASVLISLAAALVLLILDSFIVPIMYRFGLTAVQAWRYFIPWLSAHAAEFILYALFVVALGFGVGIACVVVGLLTLCCGFLLMMLPVIGTAILLPVHVIFRTFSLEFLAQLDPGLDVLNGYGSPEG
jgi:hypothetical protein